MTENNGDNNVNDDTNNNGNSNGTTKISICKYNQTKAYYAGFKVSIFK